MSAHGIAALCSKAITLINWALWHFRDNIGLAICRASVKRLATRHVRGIPRMLIAGPILAVARATFPPPYYGNP